MSIVATAPAPQAASAPPRRLAILGATGSIGGSCARVIAAAPGRFSVVSVAGGRDGAALARRAIELGAEFAARRRSGVLRRPQGGPGRLRRSRPRPVRRRSARRRCARRTSWSRRSSARPGSSRPSPPSRPGAPSRSPTRRRWSAPARSVMATAARAGALLLPMDSEHNALFQAIGSRDPGTIAMMTITASGGPFREWSAERIAAATPEQALAHPNWVMGPKVTIDSAGLMNKGLELIEAHFLFGVPPERLDVVVHPQSIVHGLIAFADGSLIAGMACPDMRTPIAHCLAYPERIVVRRPLAGPRRARPTDLRAGGPRRGFRRSASPSKPCGRAAARRPRSTPPTRSRSPPSSTAGSDSATLRGSSSATMSAMEAARGAHDAGRRCAGARGAQYRRRTRQGSLGLTDAVR